MNLLKYCLRCQAIEDFDEKGCSWCLILEKAGALVGDDE